MLDDGWTAVTDDGLPSAQFEHTCLVTAEGIEVLTLRAEEAGAGFRG
jgi:methionyl aminopeptidase